MDLKPDTGRWTGRFRTIVQKTDFGGFWGKEGAQSVRLLDGFVDRLKGIKYLIEVRDPERLSDVNVCVSEKCRAADPQHRAHRRYQSAQARAVDVLYILQIDDDMMNLIGDDGGDFLAQEHRISLSERVTH